MELKNHDAAENCRDGTTCFTESGDRYVAFSVTNSLDQALFTVLLLAPRIIGLHPDHPNPKWKPNRANALDRN